MPRARLRALGVMALLQFDRSRMHPLCRGAGGLPAQLSGGGAGWGRQDGDAAQIHGDAGARGSRGQRGAVAPASSLNAAARARPPLGPLLCTLSKPPPLPLHCRLQQEIANRRRATLEVELDDLEGYSKDAELVSHVERNTQQYLSLLAEAADNIMPQPTEENLPEDVFDVMLDQVGSWGGRAAGSWLGRGLPRRTASLGGLERPHFGILHV